MPTYKIQIYGDRNYRSQEILIDGVNNGNAALDVARSRYPGANVKSARLVDNYDIGRREEHNRREEERKKRIEEEKYRYKEQERRIKEQSLPHFTPTQTHYTNTNTSPSGSEMSMSDIGAWMALIVLFLAIAYWYITIPILIICGIVWYMIKRGLK
tara:strand:+ start:167 stop:634 length:468 start_codon:yes stop_codon:yes gene_type:complete